MKTRRIETFELILDKSEIYNMVRVLVDYLDLFEKDSHEIDTYTKERIYEMLYAYNDKNYTKEVDNEILKIQKRHEERS